MPHVLRVLLSLLAAAWLSAPLISLAQQPAKVDFARQVQPILAKRCFHCHGNDKAEGGLRLHKRETALAALDSGEHAVVPGKTDQSALLKRITAADESERMPPEGKPLSAEQIDAIRRWIEQGANWEEHWAFQTLQRREPPA